MIVEPKSGWVEGVFILVALCVQVLITAFSDYGKDTKFVNLQSMNREESLPVLRGKNGSMQTVSIWQMVVGDVLLLQPGDKIPADCLILESNNLTVKEITRHDNGDEVDTFTSQNLYKNATESPFLYCDSFVLAGTCKALVCCVGENSSRGINDTQYDTADRKTDLTKKLDAIGGTLKYIGLIGAVIVLGVSLLVLFLQVGVSA
jgi:magnesium-transporting ATPase (P-type)